MSIRRTQEPWAQMNKFQQEEKGTTEQSRRNGPCKLCALKGQFHKGQKGISQAGTWEHSPPEVKSCRKCCQTTSQTRRASANDLGGYLRQ